MIRKRKLGQSAIISINLDFLELFSFFFFLDSVQNLTKSTISLELEACVLKYKGKTKYSQRK